MADLSAADLPVREQLQEQHTRTKIGLGPDSPSTSKQLEYTMTLTSTTSSGTKKIESLELLHKRCEREGFPADLMKPWLKQLSEMPSHMWRRPFGTMIGETPPSKRTGSLQDFYISAVQSLQKCRPTSKTTESHPSMCHQRAHLFQPNRTPTSSKPTSHGGLLLCL